MYHDSAGGYYCFKHPLLVSIGIAYITAFPGGWKTRLGDDKILLHTLQNKYNETRFWFSELTSCLKQLSVTASCGLKDGTTVHVTMTRVTWQQKFNLKTAVVNRTTQRVRRCSTRWASPTLTCEKNTKFNIYERLNPRSFHSSHFQISGRMSSLPLALLVTVIYVTAQAIASTGNATTFHTKHFIHIFFTYKQI